jgi:hypothetical protein
MHDSNDVRSEQIGVSFEDHSAGRVVQQPVSLMVRPPAHERRIARDLEHGDVLAMPPLEALTERSCRLVGVEDRQPPPSLEEIGVRPWWLASRGLR